MKIYHMQVKYTLAGWTKHMSGREEYHVETLLSWTNIEDAPSYTEMIRYAQEGKLLEQSIRIISDDGEWFHLGRNVQDNYPYKINHLHVDKTR